MQCISSGSLMWNLTKFGAWFGVTQKFSVLVLAHSYEVTGWDLCQNPSPPHIGYISMHLTVITQHTDYRKLWDISEGREIIFYKVIKKSWHLSAFYNCNEYSWTESSIGNISYQSLSTVYYTHIQLYSTWYIIHFKLGCATRVIKRRVTNFHSIFCSTYILLYRADC